MSLKGGVAHARQDTSCLMIASRGREKERTDAPVVVVKKKHRSRGPDGWRYDKDMSNRTSSRARARSGSVVSPDTSDDAKTCGEQRAAPAEKPKSEGDVNRLARQFENLSVINRTSSSAAASSSTPFPTWQRINADTVTICYGDGYALSLIHI